MSEPYSQVRIDFLRWVLSMSDDECRVALSLVEVVKAERGVSASRQPRRTAAVPTVLKVSN